MLDIMMEQKKPEKCELTFSGDVLRKYFPRSYTPQQMQETIIIFALAGTVFAILAASIFFAVNRTNGIIVLVFAFLVSPFGLPMLAMWLLGKLQDLRYALQDWLY